jgi:hypothetical protein
MGVVSGATVAVVVLVGTDFVRSGMEVFANGVLAPGEPPERALYPSVGTLPERIWVMERFESSWGGLEAEEGMTKGVNCLGEVCW